MNIATERTCPLCSGGARQLFIKDDIAYFVCTSCSFRFSNPDENANFETSYSELEDAYKAYLQKQSKEVNTFQRYLNWIESFTPLNKDSNVLEIGCGSSAFFSYLENNRAVKITGLEPSQALFDAFKLEKKNIFCKTLKKLAETGPAPYDAVIFFEVLEHVDDIPDFFEDLKRVTRKGSFIFLSAPNTDSFVARVMGRYWHQYHKYHLSYFNNESLLRWLEKTPFRQRDTRTIWRTISLNYLLNYLLNFMLKSESKTDLGKNIYFPFNIYDLFWVVLERTG
jgi:2-polyprenyl-3-methyl-5-hydroxy-6-metoxy-1,4-benzoquinol methylase